MGTFAAQMTRNGLALDRFAHAVHDRTADDAFDAIVNGSAFVGAPGQPVALPIFEHAGALRDSWQKERKDASLIVLWTDAHYAPAVEDNLRGMRFGNHGPHSVKLTVLGGQRLVERAVEIVGASA